MRRSVQKAKRGENWKWTARNLQSSASIKKKAEDWITLQLLFFVPSVSSNASVWFTHFNLSLIPTVAAPTFLFLVRVSGKIIRIKDCEDKTRTKNKKRVRTTLETLYNFGCDPRAPCTWTHTRVCCRSLVFGAQTDRRLPGWQVAVKPNRGSLKAERNRWLEARVTSSFPWIGPELFVFLTP